MKGKKTLLIILLVLVLLGIAGFLVKGFLMKRLSNAGVVGNLVKNVITKEEGTTAGDVIKGTLDQLIQSGKSVKCTFSDDSDGTKVEATSYISGEKFRTDSTTTDEDGKIEFHMISDGTYAYSWGDTMETGLKMKFSDFENNDAEKTTNAATQKDFSIANAMKGYNYNCQPWLGDPTKFIVPTNVQFQDLTEMMKNLTKDMCKNCDSLDDEEQIASCKESLNCN